MFETVDSMFVDNMSLRDSYYSPGYLKIMKKFNYMGSFN